MTKPGLSTWSPGSAASAAAPPSWRSRSAARRAKPAGEKGPSSSRSTLPVVIGCKASQSGEGPVRAFLGRASVPSGWCRPMPARPLFCRALPYLMAWLDERSREDEAGDNPLLPRRRSCNTCSEDWAGEPRAKASSKREGSRPSDERTQPAPDCPRPQPHRRRGRGRGRQRQGGPRRHRPRHLRPGDRGRPGADHHPRRRPRPAHRRSRPRQDQAGRDHRHRLRPLRRPRPVHPRPDAVRHPRLRGDGRRPPTAAAPSASCPARSSPSS